MEFYDFDVEIGRGSGRDYPVKVHSPTGEPSGTMRFPFDSLELKNHLQAVEISLLRSGGTRRDIASDEERAVQDFGHQLFDALLNNRVREGFRRSRDRAHSEGKGLRVRLRIEAPELACLPWEFLYDAEEGDYVCLSTDTPIIRYIELARPTQSLTVEPPLRVLGVIASPNDRPSLKVENEKHRIEAALERMKEAGLIHLTWLEGQGWRDLQRAMLQGPYHIFHFVGHGGFDANSGQGLIALVDENGGTHRLRATDLGRLLVGHRSLSLVVLNSCEGARGSKLDIFSSTASILIRRGVPAVVAMQYEITDAAAVEFARSLYEALAYGLPVDVAVAEARKAISLSVNNTVEWGTPVLHMRSPDGILFRIEDPTPSFNPLRAQRPARPEMSPPSKWEASSIERLWAQRKIASWPVRILGILILTSLVILSIKALHDSFRKSAAVTDWDARDSSSLPPTTSVMDSAYNKAFDLYIGDLSGQHGTRGLSNARDSLNELIRLHPTSYRVPDALFTIGTSFIPTSPDSAEYYFESVVKRHPESYRTAAALYLIGNYTEERDDTTAKQIYQRVVRDYPVSPWHDLALGRLRELSEAEDAGKPRPSSGPSRDTNKPTPATQPQPASDSGQTRQHPPATITRADTLAIQLQKGEPFDLKFDFDRRKVNLGSIIDTSTLAGFYLPGSREWIVQGRNWFADSGRAVFIVDRRKDHPEARPVDGKLNIWGYVLDFDERGNVKYNGARVGRVTMER